ncbi:carboxymuconolactone decarboxylase family protein [Hyphomonas sp.]|uniref:carboxymuconolactone decarboxylase family protein n=1 Tax=Hyphomonas sp. TaxID=87 RepID=UPI003262ED43
MFDFTIYSETNAPKGSEELLLDSKKRNGMIANLHGIMAEAPELLVAYRQLNDLFIASSLDKDEITVVWQTINVENNCHYCVPAHTLIAKGMKVDDAIIDALRNETPLPNARLEALRDFTLSIVRDRGRVNDAKVQAFLDAGFTKRNILEVILGYSQKIMSNYTNHLADTPLDSVFEKFAWEKA